MDIVNVQEEVTLGKLSHNGSFFSLFRDGLCEDIEYGSLHYAVGPYFYPSYV